MRRGLKFKPENILVRTAENLKKIKTAQGRFCSLFDIYDLFRDCIMGLSGGCFIA